MGSLRGYIGLRAAEEARLGEFWPEEYERQNHGTPWAPMRAGSGTTSGWKELDEDIPTYTDFGAVEDIDPEPTPKGELRRRFFNRLKEAKRSKRFLSRALFREARTMDDVYALATLVAEFDEATPDWMRDPAKCAYADLRPMSDLWDFVVHLFTKVEARIRRLMRRPKYALQCWVDDHKDTVVRHDGAEGFLRAFRPSDQMKIAKRAVYVQ
jgi:hypothetical protein